MEKDPPYFVCINDVKEGKDLNILKIIFLKENFIRNFYKLITLTFF